MGQITEERIGNTDLLAAGATYAGKDVLTNKLPGIVKSPTDAITKKQNDNATAAAGALQRAANRRALGLPDE